MFFVCFVLFFFSVVDYIKAFSLDCDRAAESLICFFLFGFQSFDWKTMQRSENWFNVSKSSTREFKWIFQEACLFLPSCFSTTVMVTFSFDVEVLTSLT